MFILLCKQGSFIKEYKENKFVEFEEIEKYKRLGLVYPFMCIFKDNLESTEPALLMLSFDSKMRLQYRYNEAHIIKSQTDKLKYVKLMITNIDSAVSQISADIQNSENEESQLLALMALITMQTGIRIGKDVHFKTYESVGLSTLMCKNVSCKDENKCIFDFIGKKGVHYRYEIENKECCKLLNKLIKKCDSPTSFIFKTSTRKLTYTDFNDYVKSIFGNMYVSGKDFRTLLANVSFLEEFRRLSPKYEGLPTQKVIESNIKESVKHVASVLQNTNAVSKKSYIFKTIIEYIHSNYKDVVNSKDIISLIKRIFHDVS